MVAKLWDEQGRKKKVGGGFEMEIIGTTQIWKIFLFCKRDDGKRLACHL
ncbi:protein of unknown function [Candidatus Methylacidiphilum fumarolicum]|uniref:Uncharacterized protein n=1 Tax=Candidatus Methylacidiphilum fumarolicum TaxID=591154 RepID=A0ABN8XIW3_9BACT|nr:protein of unknown function [Candidatus Methylacidiphilum fumarolicum]